jgi:hypothetical protein
LPIVEEATQADLDKLVEMDTKVFEDKAVSPWVLRMFSRYEKVYTIKEDDNLLGSAYCITEWVDEKKSEKNVYLARFFIKEEERNKGNGTFLIGELLKILKQDKFSRVRTTVNPKNIAVIQILCNHYGFNGLKFLLNEEGKGQHRLCLDLDLDRMTFRRGKEKKFYIKSGKKDVLSGERMLANPEAPAEIRRLIDDHYICRGIIRFKGKDYLYFTRDLTYI